MITMQRSLCVTGAAIGVAACLSWFPAWAETVVPIKNTDIGGVVSGPTGTEAGVWVIAETHELPTRYAKMVVTDDRGRFVIPDLPTAKYSVWVRGYGLVDSPRVEARPGERLELEAVPATSEAAAAQYYPAIYWYSMLRIPNTDQFGGKSDIPQKGDAERMAQSDEEQRLHRLSPTR
jgi:hypothetical protein